MTRTLLGLLGCLVAWGASASTGYAQDRHLELAERALGRSDYERAAELAQAGIESGMLEGQELGALYRVIGFTAAHRGEEAAARSAFTRMLAFDPEFRLDRDQPAEVRSPYMEARGFWSTQPIRLAADVSANEAFDGVVVRVTDPGELVARIRLRARIEGADRFVEIVQPPAPEVRIPLRGLEQAGALDYIIGFLDEYGNRIWQQGSEEEPQHLDGPVAEPIRAQGATAGVGDTGSTSVDSTPYYAAGGAILGLGGAALIGAGVAHAERESAAGRWNSASECGGSGLTRADVCGEERSTIDTTEVAAAVLYGVGGALVVAGTVLLVVAPSGAESDSTAALECGIGLTGVACQGAF